MHLKSNIEKIVQEYNEDYSVKEIIWETENHAKFLRVTIKSESGTAIPMKEIVNISRAVNLMIDQKDTSKDKFILDIGA